MRVSDLTCRRSVSLCIDLTKKQSGTLRLHRRHADTSSFTVAATPRQDKCRRLSQQSVFIFKYGQSIIPGRDLKESLVFQSELKKEVSRSKPEDDGEKAEARSKNTGSPGCRQQREPAGTGPKEREESASPLGQETLKPGVSNLMGQKDSQSFSHADQISERAGFVEKDEFLVRHFACGFQWS